VVKFSNEYHAGMCDWSVEQDACVKTLWTVGLADTNQLVCRDCKGHWVRSPAVQLDQDLGLI